MSIPLNSQVAGTPFLDGKFPSWNWLKWFQQIGNAIPNFAFGVVPAGLINGSNKNFALPQTPITGTLAVYADKLRVTAFVQNGTSLSLTTAPTSSLIVDFQY